MFGDCTTLEKTYHLSVRYPKSCSKSLEMQCFLPVGKPMVFCHFLLSLRWVMFSSTVKDSKNCHSLYDYCNPWWLFLIHDSMLLFLLYMSLEVFKENLLSGCFIPWSVGVSVSFPHFLLWSFKNHNKTIHLSLMPVVLLCACI